ncbi:MAG: Uma2 family endonuclease [Spirochaetales bacterium]|nr:Uma2 family endonuclease [Spirochaetales bacterium]
MEFFQRALPIGHYLRSEQPLTLLASEPEPDIAIVPGHWQDHTTAHPDRALLVVEIALSSLKLDRSKAEIYARAGIPEYWIVDLDQHQLEQYSDPASGRYSQRQVLGKTDNALWNQVGLDLDTFL